MSIGGEAGAAFLILLVVIIVFALLARRLQTPYPIVLVIAGLALSLVPGTPHVDLTPNFVFYVVLPPLLFSAAWRTSWRDFSHNLVSIASLACGLVAFTIIGIAFAAQWIFPGFDWRIGVILGAVVAPTDPIAASSIASRLGLPQRIVDVVEGESLVNDATGLLGVELGIALLIGSVAPTVGSVLLRFAYVVAIGVGVGAAVAVGVDWLEHQIDDAAIEVTISLLVPYAAYLAADALHASGVLAVVACGLILARRSAKFFSPSVRLQVSAVWNAIVFIVNGIVFVLIGLQLRGIVGGLTGVSLARLIGVGVLFSSIVIALRLAWVVPGARLSFAIRRRFLHQRAPNPSGRELLVVGWSGMRGVVSLAAALALPVFLPSGDPFPQRGLIVFLTFSVVVFTLVVQGLSLAPLIRRLGLAGGSGPHCEETDARRIALEAALAYLEEHRSQDRPEYAPLYDDLAQHYLERVAALAAPADDTAHHRSQHDRSRALSQELLGVERRTLLRLRDDRRINDQVLHTVEREIDLQEARLTRL